MSNDQLTILLGTVFGLVILPWCAWVTTSIFNLRTQTALFREELKAIQSMEKVLERLSK